MKYFKMVCNFDENIGNITLTQACNDDDYNNQIANSEAICIFYCVQRGDSTIPIITELTEEEYLALIPTIIIDDLDNLPNDSE